jgi:hypothetical protein
MAPSGPWAPAPKSIGRRGFLRGWPLWRPRTEEEYSAVGELHRPSFLKEMVSRGGAYPRNDGLSSWIVKLSLVYLGVTIVTPVSFVEGGATNPMAAFQNA